MMPKIQKVALVTCAILIGCGSVNAVGDKAFSGRAAVSRPFGGVLAQNGYDIGARLERCLQHYRDQRDNCLQTNVAAQLSEQSSEMPFL